MIKLVLNDIEGTTTPISFVHDKLFPYAHAHIENFIKTFADEEVVKKALLAVSDTSQQENGFPVDQAGAIALLKKWIEEDRKHTALKDIQGLIWKQGYITGELRSELYPDVEPQLKEWVARGIKLGIYSSGSVEAQRLLFAHTPAGDLTSLFSFYFDTKIGHKREQKSYENIIAATNLLPNQILFLSDVTEELDAAKAAGIYTGQLVRPGVEPGHQHPTCENYKGADSLILQLSN